MHQSHKILPLICMSGLSHQLFDGTRLTYASASYRLVVLSSDSLVKERWTHSSRKIHTHNLGTMESLLSASHLSNIPPICSILASSCRGWSNLVPKHRPRRHLTLLVVLVDKVGSVSTDSLFGKGDTSINLHLAAEVA